MERDSRRIVKRLLGDGFVLIASKGSHHKFRKLGMTVIVPHPERDLPLGTARSIARMAGWERSFPKEGDVMKYFYAVVHKDADSAFGLEFPDLPGCYSAADDMEEILPNACEALELWFEDAAAVTPMRLDQVQAMVAAELAAGAFIVAVPWIRQTGRLVRANISLDRGMLDAIDKAAAERSLTRSAFLADAARKVIERHQG